MLEKFKNIHYVSYFNYVYHLSYSGCIVGDYPLLTMDPLACFLFGLMIRVLLANAVDGLVDHACYFFIHQFG